MYLGPTFQMYSDRVKYRLWVLSNTLREYTSFTSDLNAHIGQYKFSFIHHGRLFMILFKENNVNTWICDGFNDSIINEDRYHSEDYDTRTMGMQLIPPSWSLCSTVTIIWSGFFLPNSITVKALDQPGTGPEDVTEPYRNHRGMSGTHVDKWSNPWWSG